MPPAEQLEHAGLFPASASVMPVLWVLLGLMMAAIVGAALVLWLRRWLTKEELREPGGFTLSDLRRMRDAGQISEEEFERARGRMMAAARRGLEPEDDDSDATSSA